MDNLIANKEREFYLPSLFNSDKVRIMISSLALGGAEKIVLDWAKAEVNSGKDVEIAVLYKVDKEWPLPKGVRIFRKHCSSSIENFISQLSQRWSFNKGAVSTHLIRDNILELMWDKGMKTIPVFHNGKEGWKNEPSNWIQKNVPMIIGCSDSVSEEILENTTNIPVTTIKHQASISADALSLEARVEYRKKLNIPDDALLIGSIGALKRQKNYTRAVEVLAELNKEKPAYLCIMGGILNDECKEQLSLILAKAKELNIAKNIRLVGFVNPIDKYLAACDAILNTSHHEGFSIATQEALVAGLNVVASKVNGQSEMTHGALTLIEPKSPNSSFVEVLKEINVREQLIGSPISRVDKIWSIPNSWKKKTNVSINTLFITANLNAGGAQRSLVNLAKRSNQDNESFAIAVCNGSTNNYFSNVLKENKIKAFHVAKDNNVFDIASSIYSIISKSGIEKVCFWNSDPKIKLLLSKFLSTNIEIIDVSPGAYAFDELAQTSKFQNSIGYSDKQYFERLDHLVFKHGNGDENIPYQPKNISVIQNGVEDLPQNVQPFKTKFLVNGRIAESKHFKTILSAFSRFSKDSNAELIVYGQAEDKKKEYLEEVIEMSKGLPVNFMGSKPDLEHLSHGYTSIIVLGTNQGCPNAVLEAISAGMPVIANDSGGTRELVIDGKNGYLLPKDVCEDLLLESMIKMSNSKDKIAMGKFSNQLCKKNFSMDTMYNKYKNILFFQSEEDLREAV